MITGVQPGDVLAIRTGGWEAWWIRFGAAAKGLPNLENHIAVMHHQDSNGTWWVVEGRPGGVGWANATGYLSSQWTVTNRKQPKTQTQRNQICTIVEAMLDTPYDWPAIAQDAINDLHLPELWETNWHGQTPGHVVCSSLASWAYSKTGLAYPKVADMGNTQPGDWTQFILSNSYE